MKAIFIAYNIAYNEEIVEVLEEFGQRGFTKWNELAGRGSYEGEPHYGDHAWPVENQAILSVVPDDKVVSIMKALKKKDDEFKDLGLRAYSWNVESSIETV